MYMQVQKLPIMIWKKNNLTFYKEEVEKCLNVRFICQAMEEYVDYINIDKS